MAREMKDSGIEWIGEIPREWEVTKTLNGLSMPITDGPHTTPELFDDGIAFVSAEAVSSGNGIIDFSHIRGFISQEFYDECCKKYVPEIDDIYMIKSGATTGKVAIVNTLEPVFTIWSPLAVFRSNTNIIWPKYLYYQLQSDGYQKQVQLGWSFGTQQNVGMRVLEQLKITIPPLPEQQSIADFLDTQCAHIDSVIEKTCAAVEEYKKLKQAVITQAVTKGIRPNREMKDSGIEWIGEIPKEWAVQRIKTIFNLRDERNYLPLEEVNLISLYTDKGVVQHSDLEKTTGNKASNADGYKKVYENDIIVNIILCWMGAIGRSSYQGVTSPAYDIYVPSNTIECRFYHHYFRTKGFSGDCYKRGKGIMAMRWRTYSDQFRDIKVVVPPLKEQQEILNYLDEKTAAIDSLIQKKEQLISELEAYKKSLIYEYVTGKKEAPAHAH